MTIEELKLLSDVKTAIESIEEHLQFQLDFNLYTSNKTIRRAVERELEIIDEAIYKLDKINPNNQISYKRQIVDLRNKVIHAYDYVNNIIVWKEIVKDLPISKQEVNNLLKN